tara:strand:- start:962 stop:1138 length:177 start_codon:yes stop_codon:yes gene_type:complete
MTIEWYQPIVQPIHKPKTVMPFFSVNLGSADVVELDPRKWDAGEAAVTTTWTGEDPTV